MDLIDLGRRVVIPLAGLVPSWTILSKLYHAPKDYVFRASDFRIEIPVMIGLASVWLLLTAAHMKRSRWRPSTTCRGCGYPIEALRGHATKCPECGRSF